MRKIINIALIGLLGVISISLQQSCTKYDTPDMVRIDGLDSDSLISTAIHRKVLWVNLDGAVGSIVEKNMPQGGTIATMLKNSKYSWIGMSENRIIPEVTNEDPVTWATMLTGVIPEKHHVTDYSYAANVEYDPNNANEKVIQYPNILHHIAENSYENPTLCVTPWEKLNNNMLKAAQKRVTTAGDEETRNVVLKHLTESDFEFILVSFSGMLEAGKNGGFTENNANYLSALQHIDGYLGEFMKVIDERDNSFFEDWLIIVTSNHGGTPDGQYGGNSEAERNTFGLFYYSHYSERKMDGKTLYGAYFENGKSHAIVFDTTSTNLHYALDENKNLSFEFIMRMTPKRDGTYNGGSWDAIMTKGKWGFYRQRSTVSTYIDPFESSPKLEEAITSYNDPQWHNYCFTISKMNNNSRDWTIAFDGKKTRNGTTTARGTPLDSALLRINNGVPTPFYVSEIRLWKKVLSDEEVKEQATMLDISPSDSRYKDLLAYWKLKPSEIIDESKQDTLIIRNQIESGLDLYYINTDEAYTRPIREKAFVELPNTFPAYQQTGDLVMENTLIVPQILYWLDISPATVFDGIRFIDNYVYSEDWRDLPEE